VKGHEQSECPERGVKDMKKYRAPAAGDRFNFDSDSPPQKKQAGKEFCGALLF